MKRTLAAGMVAIGLTVGSIAVAQADEGLPEHGHLLVWGEEDAPRCVELAAGRALGLNSHHDRVHVGVPGWGNPEVGLTGAGKFVVPLAPFPGADWSTCEEFFEAIGL